MGLARWEVRVRSRCEVQDTSTPGFIRTYPQACVTKFLGLAHAESFAAPGGDTELVTLGEMGCHALDVDQLNGDVSGGEGDKRRRAEADVRLHRRVEADARPRSRVGLARDPRAVPMSNYVRAAFAALTLLLCASATAHADADPLYGGGYSDSSLRLR